MNVFDLEPVLTKIDQMTVSYNVFFILSFYCVFRNNTNVFFNWQGRRANLGSSFVSVYFL